MRFTWSFVLCGLWAIAPAGCASNTTTAATQSSAIDAGATTDEGNTTQVPPPDAAQPEDGAAEADAAAQNDATPLADAGGSEDAGATLDGAVPPDVDAGLSTTDASGLTDTSTTADTAVASDAAGSNDIAKADTGSSTDAGVAADTGSSGPVDPTKPGPLTTAALDASFTNPATGDKLPVHAVYPTSGAGPFPAVVIAHGFQLAPSQYYSYATRLASYGYVAFTVDYPTSLTGNDNPKQASDLAAGLDWAATQPQWAGKIDVQHAGVTGHSLGGKLALLAATLDKRFAAAFAIDPVDGGNSLLGCNLPKCVLVAKELSKLTIATAFVGETTDAKAMMQACAPAAQNFETLFAAAPGPSFAVTVAGANHMSFLDDVAGCGFTCSFCNPAKATAKAVGDLTKSYMVAFFERRLRNNAAYDTWLTGDAATQAFITTGLATLNTK